MTDTIELRGMRVWGRHGANPGEQEVAQPIDIDLLLELDLGAARRSDALADTISYAEVHAAVTRIVAQQRFALLERMGEVILDTVMRDERVARARVALAKPRLLAGATPVVTLHRAR